MSDLFIEMNALAEDVPAGIRPEMVGKLPPSDFISPAGASFSDLLFLEYTAVACDLVQQLRRNGGVHNEASKLSALKASALWQVAELYGIQISRPTNDVKPDGAANTPIGSRSSHAARSHT